jgi:hypothetical protein
MAKGKTWVITTSGNRSIHEIAKDLAKAGLTSGQVLEEIGSITGSAGDKTVAKLRKVRGVVDVSPVPRAGVGPPDSSDTW